MYLIQAKGEVLKLEKAALLLNISTFTLRRWVLARKVKSQKVGRKHMFERKILIFKNKSLFIHL
jgi:hypothetical protein